MEKEMTSRDPRNARMGSHPRFFEDSRGGEGLFCSYFLGSACVFSSLPYLKGMARAEYRPQERDLQYSGRHSAAGHQSDDQADFQEEHQLQRPPPLHLLALLYLELHAARVPAARHNS